MSDIACKKTCFVITPIGDEGSEIRRHIDGIIEAAIIPVLESDFDVKAAHHINEPGNITKQIIKRIYESDLVIANLTGRNPNVMYELALRHCIGKPTIMISDKDTMLPSDIISERTNFYINDSKGVLELRDKICKCIAEIDFESADRKSPVYDALKEIQVDSILVDKVAKENPQDAAVLSLILNKIDSIEEKIKNKDTSKLQRDFESIKINIRFGEIDDNELRLIGNELELLIQSTFKLINADDPNLLITPTAISINLSGEKGTFSPSRINKLLNSIARIFENRKIEIKDLYHKNYYNVVS